jgi:hypothetical protein
VSKVKKAAGVRGKRNSKGGRAVKKQGDEKRAPSQSKRKAPATAVKSKALRSAPKRKASTAGGRKAGTRASRTSVASGVKGTRTAKSATKKAKPGRMALVRGRGAANGVPVVKVAIRELDPLRKCGPNTTVQFLYRVDESVDGRSTAHLVFFDRHGWYCEHGRTCPAVGHAKKYNGQIARVS